jgi:hypothetical protein
MRLTLICSRSEQIQQNHRYPVHEWQVEKNRVKFCKQFSSKSSGNTDEHMITRRVIIGGRKFQRHFDWFGAEISWRLENELWRSRHMGTCFAGLTNAALVCDGLALRRNWMHEMPIWEKSINESIWLVCNVTQLTLLSCGISISERTKHDWKFRKIQIWTLIWKYNWLISESWEKKMLISNIGRRRFEQRTAKNQNEKTWTTSENWNFKERTIRTTNDSKLNKALRLVVW